MTKDQQPWILVEAKTSGKASLSKNLVKFQSVLSAPFAFQVAHDLPYIEQDCFAHNKPIIVPAKTFLSQLI